jgi:8-oxo-dGTP diphosphatase
MSDIATNATEDDEEFLADYDPNRYQRPSLAVDVVLLTVANGVLRTLLVKRDDAPQKGRYALPGGFVGINESLDDAAMRVLAAKAGVTGIYIEQLYTFGALERDPRTRVISVAYYALVPPESLVISDTGIPANVVVPWEGETGGSIRVVDDTGTECPLAFDHTQIIGMAVKRLRGKVWYAPVAFEIVPAKFTLLDLRRVYETILGRSLNKDSFRRRIIDATLVAPTGDATGDGAAHRPAELYEFVGRKGLTED